MHVLFRALCIKLSLCKFADIVGTRMRIECIISSPWNQRQNCVSCVQVNTSTSCVELNVTLVLEPGSLLSRNHLLRGVNLPLTGLYVNNTAHHRVDPSLAQARAAV